VDYLVNGVWLKDQWTAAAAKLNTGVDSMSGTAIAGYVVGDFLYAILIVWLYAAIRTRFGAGRGTAAKASGFVWVLTAIFACQTVILGLYPAQLVATSSIGSLVGMIAAGYVGGMIYTE
jgi:tetrahydromethanopterin S-methyltransferase subunit F